MLSITCLKCGKVGEFFKESSIWTAGWVPITRDQHVCDICSQLEYTNDFDVELEEEVKKRAPKKKTLN